MDTSLSLENGKVEVDLYKKKTSRNQYLLPASCHPKTTTQAIPFSLSLRIVRICTKQYQRDLRLSELKELLEARQYPKNLIERAIEKAKKIPRKVALLKVKPKNTENRPIFATKYDPRMPALAPMLAKHWRSMTNTNAHLKECFPQPPLTAYRRQQNLRDILIKSKLPPPPRKYPKREVKGMTKCEKSCPSCPFIKEAKNIKIDKFSNWNINKKFTCESYNVVYLLECQKCGHKYIGSTKRKLKHRLAEHKGYIYNQVTNRATGAHWNLPGHSLAHLKVIILEQSKYKDEEYIREREKYFIRKFDTFNRGINREW